MIEQDIPHFGTCSISWLPVPTQWTDLLEAAGTGTVEMTLS